ncbi:MAG: polyphosphate kinase 1 [Pseudomonadota bacterium]|nr:polyphosphate kinase 1 [Pseudomonadota bacterium]
MEAKFFNPELSRLMFIKRVFAQACDQSLPLLERLNYLFITSGNLDEFFEVAVAALKDKIALSRTEASIDGMQADELLKMIAEITHPFVKDIYDVYNNDLTPAMHLQSIEFLPRKKWTKPQREWIQKFFTEHAMPVISPIALDLSHPFPRLVNKSLNYIVSLEGADAFGRESGLAIIHAPRSLPRILRIPSELCEPGDYFVQLNDLIQAHLDDFFPGMTATGCYQFRITRNSDLYINSDEESDLTLALESELASKRYGASVRMEIDANCPDHIIEYLLAIHYLGVNDLYKVDGPVNLHRSSLLLKLLERNDLRFPAFQHQIPERLDKHTDMFSAIREKDILMHLPYDSFDPVLNLIYQAAHDPNVLAIKSTLYRTGVDSPMVKALIEAARVGKEVTIVIELRARFDEAENIALANQLQEAGALVIYGILGYKVHAKLSLIVRREGKDLGRYAHLGTGNYHADTARLYTDFGLFTYNSTITDDVLTTFQQLTGMSKELELDHLIASPFKLHKTVIALIEAETQNAQNGKKARIKAKVNGLTDKDVIVALYNASQAGVKIQLQVRGICCLIPGVKDLSENITVTSIIGRFLEHARVYCFYNDGNEKIYCSSADWMERNFFFRVEICFPILDPALAKTVKKRAFDPHLNPNSKQYQLKSDGEYFDITTISDNNKH